MSILTNIITFLGKYDTNTPENGQIQDKDLSPTQVLEGISNGSLFTLDMTNSKDPMANNYVIHRGIHMLAQNIAQLPLKIYRGEEPMPRGYILPGGFDIHNPNYDMSLYELLYEGSVYYFYRGEMMFKINMVGNSDNVLSLETVNPKRMEEIVDKKTGRITSWKWGKELIIPNDELIYTKFFNPDGLRGLGPVEVVENELTTDKDATDFNIKFFENFGKVGGMLYDDNGTANIDDMRKLATQFDNAHRGKGNAYKVLGLPDGIKYQEMRQSMEEMQFLESRRDIRDRILVILGIHKALVGVTDSVDRAVADAAMRSLWQLTLKPSAIRIQNKLNQNLFKRYYPEYRCAFDFSVVEELKTDQKIKTETALSYRELGYTLNEINERWDLGMNEVDDEAGNTRLVPQNMIPFTDYTEPDPVVEERSVTPVEEKRPRTPRGVARRHHNLERKVETQIYKKLKRHFSDQRLKVKKIINGTKDIDRIGILADVRVLLEEEKAVLQGIMTPIYEQGSKEAVGLAAEAMNVVAEPHINEAVVREMTNKVARVENQVYNAIRKQVVEATEKGESMAQLSKRIDKVYNFTAAKARTIARTEAGALINRSTNAEYAQAGVEMKSWLANPGARDTHSKVGAQRPIPFNQPFANGLMYPHDPNGPASEVINCRCTLVPVIEG